MLKILAVSRSNLSRRRARGRVYPGQRVSRKYRRAVVRRAEYRRLQKLIPNIARRRKVPELTVILEAVKYIDVLHSAIADRVRTIKGLQSAGDDRKSQITPDVRDVTNDPTQQVSFLSSRIYQQTTGGAPPFGRCLYPHPSSVALPETSSSCATAHQRHCGRIQMRGRREADSSISSSSHVKGVSSGEKMLRMSVSAAAGVMASRDSSSCQMLTTKRRLTSADCFNLATNNNASHCKR